MKKLLGQTLIFGVLSFFAACGGGGGTPTPPVGGQQTEGFAFSVVLTAEPDQGPAPLKVAFSGYAFGGKAPYQFAWDFNGDNITDSTETNPFYTFSSSAVVKLTVTDSAGRVVVATRTITITTTTGPDLTPPLVVTFTASVVSGTAPLQVVFEAVVSGGVPPYRYSWDLDGDGTPDRFTEKVVWEYTAPGTPTAVPGGIQYFYYPSLTVTDGRNVQRSTLDDTNGDQQPDWRVVINVMPKGQLSPSIRANPVTGQAPLPVELSAGASGGVPPYEFKWDFGDGVVSEWTEASFIEHVYQDSGVYYARVTVKDAQNVQEVSGVAVITVLARPTFQVTISADVTEGSVPLKVEFTAVPSGGREPISYLWQVFSDVTPWLPEPSVIQPPQVPEPSLDPQAVVVPTQTNEASPTIVFGTYEGQQIPIDAQGNTSGVGAPYVVRLIATDANGVQAFSNLIRIRPVAPEPPEVYEALRAPKVGDSIYSPGTSPSFTPRANPAVATHPFGVVFVFGGDILTPNGEFAGVVDLLDSAWALNLSGQDIGNPDAQFPNGPIGYRNGGWTQLGVIPLYPYPEDGAGNRTVPNPDGYAPGYARDDRVILRGDIFQPRGSAAAALVHEPVDTNSEVGYGRNPFEPPIPDDQGNGPLGVPVIYVFGGRDANGNALDIVQKYYPSGFGTEGLPVDTDQDLDGEPDAQVTNNQVDIWTNRFQFHDWDLWPQMGDQTNPPIVPDRPPQEAGSGGGAVPLARLPEPLYGHAAVTVESVGWLFPVWPEGPFYYVFILGGINDRGQVVPTMRWFDTRRPPGQRQEGQEPEDGDYSRVVDMPVARAYHKAFVIPPSVAGNRPWQIIVFGGYDVNGNYVSQVDRFTFSNTKNPTTGFWETIGYVPEAVAGGGAGWEFDERGFVYHQFAGRMVEGFTGSVFDMLPTGSVSYAPYTLLPRGWFGFGQIGIAADYYMIGGLTEQGMTSVIERYRP